MANGQATASPAEIDGAGIPEILTNPESVPEARAFYSSHPDASDNISARPDAPEDIQFAIVLDSAGQTPNGKINEVLHASRFIALRDEHHETGNVQNFVILDHGLALKGLRWIRKNVKNEDIHRSSVESKSTLEKELERKERLVAQQQAETENEERQQRHLGAEAKRANEKKQKAQKRNEELQLHSEALAGEKEKLAKWREENPPPEEANVIEILDMFEGRPTKKGGIKMKVIAPSAFNDTMDKFIRYIAENPHSLRAEIRYSAQFSEFLEGNDMPLLQDVFEMVQNASSQAWRERLAFADPEDFKRIMPKWVELVAGLSQEYKQSVKFEGHKMDTDDAFENEDGPLYTDAAINHYSNFLIHNSLIKLAASRPKEFIDAAYELAQSAGNTNDEFTFKNILYVIQNAQLISPDVNMFINNGAIAKGVDYDTRIHTLDLKMAMVEIGCVVGGLRKKATLSPNLQRNYRALYPIALAHGIDPEPFHQNNDLRGLERKISQVIEEPMEESIKSGELPDSLYLKVKAQKDNSPQDA